MNSNKKQLQRILIKGGVVSPSELSHIIHLTESMGSDYIHLGSRQDVLIPESSTNIQSSDYQFLDVESSANKIHQNIVSSYLAYDIFPSTRWLNGAIYLSILEQFRNKKHLEINVTDPLQSFVPLFTGHLNYIASDREDYWYLYIKLPHWQDFQLYPILIYTWDLGKIAFFIEEHCLTENLAQAIFDTVNGLYDNRNNATFKKQLEINVNPFPYYEGFNKINADQYWLGLYWRNNKYRTGFLKQLIELCHSCRIGNICITPWKSLIIKPISEQHKLQWEKFLGVNGINVRHSLLEMNWHIPVNDDFALHLKNHIVNEFNHHDISTYGLTFGLYYPSDTVFTSIVIICHQDELNNQAATFSVLYALKFDPNTLDYVTYAQDVEKEQLPLLLLELSKEYFDQLGNHTVVKNTLQIDDQKEKEKIVFQCKDCLSIYDEAVHQVSFDDLEDSFRCFLCDATKENYQKVGYAEISI